MKKQELIGKLKDLQVKGDTELQHSEADDLLLEYIADADVRYEYDKIDKWYA